MSSEFARTSGWFAATGQQPEIPTYDPKQVTFYLGMQLEELAEKVSLMGEVLSVAVNDLPSLLDEAAKEFKRQRPDIVAAVDAAVRSNPEKWLDADCDGLWVTLGAIRALGVDPLATNGGYEAVLQANWNKRWPDGTFHKDVNGKIVKPEGWAEPDHSAVTSHLRK